MLLQPLLLLLLPYLGDVLWDQTCTLCSCVEPTLADFWEKRSQQLCFGGARGGTGGQGDAGWCGAQGTQHVVSSWKLLDKQKMPRGARAPRHLCQQLAHAALAGRKHWKSFELLSLSLCGAGFLWVEEKGEGHSSPNPFPSHSHGWQLQALVRMADLSILSGLQINVVLGGPPRIWCWMVIMDLWKCFRIVFWIFEQPPSQMGFVDPDKESRVEEMLEWMFPFSRTAAAVC